MFVLWRNIEIGNRGVWGIRRMYLSKPKISIPRLTMSNTIRFLDISLEIVRVIGPIIPMDRDEIHLTAIAEVEEISQPFETTGAVSYGRGTKGGSVRERHQVSMVNVDSLLGAHTALKLLVRDIFFFLTQIGE